MLPAFNAVTASASLLPPERRLYKPEYSNDQSTLWRYYETLEEFAAAVNWKANALSRVRLVAAEFLPESDEPSPITEGPIADIMMRFAGGVGGQSQIIAESAIHLSVPGEGWLAGWEDDDGFEHWQVYSADELRKQDGVYQVRTGERMRSWEMLGNGVDVIMSRFWRPDPRRGWKARSRAAHALGAMRELEMVNKRIIAETVSRLASNGMLLYDKARLSFGNSAGPAGAQEADDFGAVLVETASRGIKDEMSAEATLPLPVGADLRDATDIKLPDLMHRIDFTTAISERLLEQRTSAITRLATVLDLPAEQLTGMGDLNHWGAAQIEESGIKIHITPDMELLCHAFTQGFLYPMLEAGGVERRGPNGGIPVVWYDPSELVMRPDRSANAFRAYDRLELSGSGMRRETGLDEADAPDDAELERMVTLLRLRAENSVRSTTERPTGDVAEADTGTDNDSGADAEPDTAVDDEAPSQAVV